MIAAQRTPSVAIVCAGPSTLGNTRTPLCGHRRLPRRAFATHASGLSACSLSQSWEIPQRNPHSAAVWRFLSTSVRPRGSFQSSKLCRDRQHNSRRATRQSSEANDGILSSVRGEAGYPDFEHTLRAACPLENSSKRSAPKAGLRRVARRPRGRDFSGIKRHCAAASPAGHPLFSRDLMPYADGSGRFSL
jgi:hypothetical protein